MLALAVVGGMVVFMLPQREARVGGKRISTLLAEMNDDDPEIASNAERLLRAIGPEAIPPLLNALNQKNPRYRGAYNSLRAKMPNFFLQLMPELEDKAVCRANSANVLASFGPAAKPAMPQLRELLHDENEKVRDK